MDFQEPAQAHKTRIIYRLNLPPEPWMNTQLKTKGERGMEKIQRQSQKYFKSSYLEMAQNALLAKHIVYSSVITVISNKTASSTFQS